MAEIYMGTKFTTIFLDKHIPDDARIKRLMLWGKKFSLLGLTPAYEFGAAGNLSFRTDEGFIITATGKDLGNLKEEDFVEVRKCNMEKGRVAACGRHEPSSETMLHCAIYEKRPEVRTIFHVHDEYAVKNCDAIGLICTQNEKPYGTKELIDEVLKVLENHDYIVIKNHGIISLGGTFDEVGERILDVNAKVQRE